jgi:hypothetical protein
MVGRVGGSGQEELCAQISLWVYSDGLLQHRAGCAERMTYPTQAASILARLTLECMRAWKTLMSLSKGPRGCTARSYPGAQERRPLPIHRPSHPLPHKYNLLQPCHLSARVLEPGHSACGRRAAIQLSPTATTPVSSCAAGLGDLTAYGYQRRQSQPAQIRFPTFLSTDTSVVARPPGRKALRPGKRRIGVCLPIISALCKRHHMLRTPYERRLTLRGVVL